jgi:UDP-3-O-[3-hydroxymyristoyl] glucosamine N-acyltransferase
MLSLTKIQKVKLKAPITLKKASEILECSFIGNENQLISGFNEIHVVEPGDVVFVDHSKYYDKALNSSATVIIIDKEVKCPSGKGLLISRNPFADFNKLTKLFMPFVTWKSTTGSDVIIGVGSVIHSSVVIGNNVVIGDNSFIHAGVNLMDNVTIGNNVVVQSNTVLGSHAFYYKHTSNGFDKMHTCGAVILEDNVEIGALCTIDAGVTGTTVIGKGTKIDNHVHIGHDCLIGKNCLFAAQVGIAGCVIIEDDVTLWGQVGVASDLTIGKGAVVLGQSGLSKSIAGNKTYLGSPVGEARMKFRELAAVRKLPVVIEKLN